MQKLNNQKDAIIRTGTIDFSGYTGHLRFDRENEKMPTQITVSINNAADEKSERTPVRLSVTLTPETGKTNLNSQDIGDITTGLELAKEVDTWLKAYAADLKTEIEGGTL